MVDIRTTPIAGIDCHAHVFSRGLELAAVRRYTPDYDATLAQYLGHLHAHGLSHGVLVQPSFLGTDNRYLLAALRQAPQQLRGVVVVERDVSRAELDDMARLGVAGVRLNLMGKALPDFRDVAWNGFLRHLAELDWHIELHANLVDLPGLIGQLLPFGVRLVVDHFGRPDARQGLDQPGFAQLMELGQGGQVWMKVSGIYRLGATAPRNLEFARASLAVLERSFGPERLVWGSDWPHTQHEAHVGFETVMAQLRALECSASLMHALMVQAPQALFKF
ncbi:MULTISPECIES: amidohydrolase [unclassified Pseudomonas]|uniref:amidohydrolase family protein n=1 Tax=unclassified Pseudomonas TaxID=196821 RepID=UPI0008764639|nr:MULTISPECIES: amidohydrolase family protein [unclassified Pseudomonas]SCZ19118.1 Predicted metal-dependent hydrolase, TIM-barrel fold [Pseudomonas sp. NFACC44-2]SDA46887.1 Predicted metal-dependent hydrolase, TIM-barrel fold [Pseudomonas sp. NFACC51]SEI42531.1 Predicted metal-dependent hydrolase, TIM-barrel fold [Pseudomonas sp. NFACC07-1]SFH01880.1 Predicted metal-dependent hydrolase, TIM-barrel fold [Pseudomonas sp. NFACC54]SFS37377.1 Predicted metal-dependent hydrolase, TIM-barrel fold [